MRHASSMLQVILLQMFIHLFIKMSHGFDLIFEAPNENRGLPRRGRESKFVIISENAMLLAMTRD